MSPMATGCAECKKDNASKRCSQCKWMFYCNKDCAAKHWRSEHRAECPTLLAMKANRERIKSVDDTAQLLAGPRGRRRRMLRVFGEADGFQCSGSAVQALAVRRLHIPPARPCIRRLPWRRDAGRRPIVSPMPNGGPFVSVPHSAPVYGSSGDDPVGQSNGEGFAWQTHFDPIRSQSEHYSLEVYK